MKMNKKIFSNLWLWFALIHLAAFFLTAIYISSSPQAEGWKSIIWIFWFPVDFPWSTLHFVINHGQVAQLVDQLSSQSVVWQYVLYSPYLIHGVIGTIWWGFLPSIWSKYRHQGGKVERN
jgi:hypothetical protein